MKLDVDAPAERQTPCAKVAERCLRRIREILRQADPADPALRRLLEDVERQHGFQLESVRSVEGCEDGNDDDPRQHFPSLQEHLGEGPLNRDCAMFYVESLKEEAWRFFQNMARRAMDDDARAVYTRIALHELGEVARLRTMIL
jgi:hypothetical protein